MRAAIAAHEAVIADTSSVLRLWDKCLRVPDWSGPPTWFHGDLHSANVIVTGGRVSAIIDFGHLGVGDPACDLLIAWSMLPCAPRDELRDSLAVDDATWLRGRGWALAIGAASVAYSARHEILDVVGRAALTEAVSDTGESISWVQDPPGPATTE